MKFFLIALSFLATLAVEAHTLEVGKTYIGVDANGKSCTLDVQETVFYTDLGQTSLGFWSNSKSECSFYSKTNDQIIVRDLNWSEGGDVIQLTVNLNNGSYVVERGIGSLSRTLACYNFKLFSHRSNTCYNLVLK